MIVLCVQVLGGESRSRQSSDSDWCLFDSPRRWRWRWQRPGEKWNHLQILKFFFGCGWLLVMAIRCHPDSTFEGIRCLGKLCILFPLFSFLFLEGEGVLLLVFEVNSPTNYCVLRPPFCLHRKEPKRSMSVSVDLTFALSASPWRQRVLAEVAVHRSLRRTNRNSAAWQLVPTSTTSSPAALPRPSMAVKVRGLAPRTFSFHSKNTLR